MELIKTNLNETKGNEMLLNNYLEILKNEKDYFKLTNLINNTKNINYNNYNTLFCCFASLIERVYNYNFNNNINVTTHFNKLISYIKDNNIKKYLNNYLNKITLQIKIKNTPKNNNYIKKYYLK